MTFTGTLIEGLIATVERAEQAAQPDEALVAETWAAEPLVTESLFASVQENTSYDSIFLGVA